MYNILIEFDVPMKRVSLTKLCLSETFIRFQVGKYLSDVFLFEECFETRRCFIAIAFQTLLRSMPLRGFG